MLFFIFIRLLFKKIFVLTLMALPVCISIYAPAQTSLPLHFESLTINNGLSQGFVSGIEQDKKGLMWFTTSDGLNKYDGYTFTIYHHDAADTTSIASDDLTCVFEDSKERLWIGTRHHGIDLFDRENSSFIHFRHAGENSLRSDDVLNITEDRSGALWIRTRQGIDRLEVTAAKPASINPRENFFQFHKFLFTHIRLDSAFEAVRNKYDAEKIFVDSWNDIFITTNDKIWEIDYDEEKDSYRLLQRFRFNVSDSSVIPDIIEDTLQKCLLVNNGGIIKFSNYDFARAEKLYRYATPQAKVQVPLTIDKSRRLWITDNKGIVLIDLRSPEKQAMVSVEPLLADPVSTATVFYTDRTGVVWIATGGYGILKYDPVIERFHHILPQLNCYQLLEGAPGQVITSSFRSVTIQKGQPAYDTQLANPFSLQKDLAKTGILSFAKDNAGEYWVAMAGAIIRYTAESKKIRVYDLPATDKRTLPFPVFADSKNNIWMGYNRYFVRYTPSLGRFTKFEYPIRLASYDYDFLQCIYEDNDSLWLGSVNGIFCFDMTRERMSHCYVHRPGDSNSLSHNFVFSFCNDIQEPQRYLWVGTKGGGLNRLDKASGTFLHYSIKNGLANNVVYGILPADDGHLWLSTNRGLSQFDPRSGYFRNFDASDGLQGNEFNRYAYCKTSEGLLVFGGLNGINYFDPREIQLPEPPEVIITDFRLFNKPVDFKKAGLPIKTDIGYTDEVVLRYEQNVITFQFAAMDYRKAGKARYRYRMQGFDKDWIYSGTMREATYTNLDPGEYSFMVQGSFENRTWSTRQASLRIRVIPPWWRTWWFYILTAMVTLSLIYAVDRYRLYQLIRLERLRNRIARDLHDEVGSSISTIAIYSKIVQEHLRSSSVNNENLLKKITENAAEIMESMNDIIWNINTKNDAFEHIINRMREHAYELFEAKDCVLHFDFDEGLYRMKLEMEKRRDFYLIYKEALNNIAKYADGKNVWISLTLNHAEIHLVIKDDGKGFDMASVGKRSNGLNNMQYRATTLKGKMRIISAPGAGTEISLSFTPG